MNIRKQTDDAKRPPSGLPYLFHRRPRCRQCGGKRFLAYKTLPPSGDGSTARYVKCRECGVRCILVEE